MPGKSKEDAFRIGHEIADAITARNPKPMKMKFEKVRFSHCFAHKYQR
jgi:DNA polymerase zeta